MKKYESNRNMSDFLIYINAKYFLRAEISCMKNILIQSLIVGGIAAIINAVLAFLLGGSILDTPYVGPNVTETEPVSVFAVKAGVMTFLLTFIGALILSLLARKNTERGVRIWRIIGIVFLVLYGIMPFVAPVANVQAAILVNILHLVAGFAALYYIPKRAKIV